MVLPCCRYGAAREDLRASSARLNSAAPAAIASFMRSSNDWEGFLPPSGAGAVGVLVADATGAAFGAGLAAAVVLAAGWIGAPRSLRYSTQRVSTRFAASSK